MKMNPNETREFKLALTEDELNETLVGFLDGYKYVKADFPFQSHCLTDLGKIVPKITENEELLGLLKRKMMQTIDIDDYPKALLKVSFWLASKPLTNHPNDYMRVLLATPRQQAMAVYLVIHGLTTEFWLNKFFEEYKDAR